MSEQLVRTQLTLELHARLELEQTLAHLSILIEIHSISQCNDNKIWITLSNRIILFISETKLK